MQHNLLVVNPGSADEIAKLAMSMGADGFKKQFNPQTKDVLLGSKLLNEGEKEVLEITFTKPGKYPFICTFPASMRSPLKRRFEHHCRQKKVFTSSDL